MDLNTGIPKKRGFRKDWKQWQGFIWMIQTIEHHKVGEEIGMYIEPDAIHIMNRSEYSGEFGDYSYFSDEMDHISDASYNWEEENEEE